MAVNGHPTKTDPASFGGWSTVPFHKIAAIAAGVFVKLILIGGMVENES